MAAKTLDYYGREVLIRDGTAGSVQFVNSAGELTEDNANFNYNDTTNTLAVKAQIEPTSATHGFSNWQPVAATSGTDTTPASGSHFVTSIFVPANKTVTGASYLIGSVGGTNLVYAALYAAGGTVVTNSDVAGGGVTVGTAANSQSLAFTSTAAIKGPALYYVGISMNGTTARLRTVPAFTSGGILGNTVTQTHGTVANITVPGTFVADKAPIVFLY
jgi:hypothetical protein